MAEWLTWDQQRLEDEYSPTKWSKRCPNGEPAQWILDNHIQLVTQESNEVRKAVPCQLDRVYGVREGEKFDIYGAESLPKDAPVFVYIHGGYWQLLGRPISAYCVKPLYQEGIITIIIGYDLAPKVEFHEIIEQIQAAISAILHWAAERGSRGVAVGGHSAGAHLAAMLMYRENDWAGKEQNLNLIKALVHISGVFDLRPIAMTSINDPLKLTSATAEKFSPIHNLEKLNRNLKYLKHIQQLVVVAENDPNEFKRQSHEYAQALRDAGFQVEHKVLDSLDHFDIVEKLRENDYSLTKDIVQLLTSE